MRHRPKAVSAGLGLATASLLLLVLPVSSMGAGLLNQVVNRVSNTTSNTVQTVRRTAPQVRQAPRPALRRQASSGARLRGATPSAQGGYTPAAHGTNPRGQGSVAVLDLAPSGVRPLGGNPSGAGTQPQLTEEVVAGRARGEQQADGSYHGHITIAALLGNEILGVDTRPGQSATGPLSAVQEQILNQICNGSSQQICLTAVQADSATTGSGSTNRFAVLRATVGSLHGDVATSDGNIAQDGSCQNAHGASQVANVTNSGQVVASAATSSTDSRACSDGTQSQSNASQVLNLGGSGVPIPAPGCGAGTPNTVTGIPVLLPIVCNADDSNATQNAVPYGVREALSIFGLDAATTALLKTVASSSESHAVAPAVTRGPGGRGPGGGRRGERRGPGAGGRRGRRAAGVGPGAAGPRRAALGARAAGPGRGRGGLPLTGTDLVLLLMLGGFTLAGGLTLRKAVARRATA
jgi:hypothetical protein